MCKEQFKRDLNIFFNALSDFQVYKLDVCRKIITFDASNACPFGILFGEHDSPSAIAFKYKYRFENNLMSEKYCQKLFRKRLKKERKNRRY